MTAAYLERVKAGGCRRLSCREQGRPEFAVWWKCPAGHREELRYCEEHGPAHLGIAMQGARIKCKSCGGWMTPQIEGWNWVPPDARA
jgi:hypothetical protein